MPGEKVSVSLSMLSLKNILENDNIIAQPREHFIQVVSV